MSKSVKVMRKSIKTFNIYLEFCKERKRIPEMPYLELITKNCSDLRKDMNLHIQKAQYFLNLIIKTKSHFDVMKLHSFKHKDLFKTEKNYHYKNNDVDSKFLTTKKKNQKALGKHLQILKGNNSSFEILGPAKLLCKNGNTITVLKILKDIILIIYP